MQKCPSCGTISEDSDDFCGNCGNALPKVREITDETVAALILLEPREALRKLFTSFPWVLDGEETFNAAIGRLYAQDTKTRLRCTGCFTAGLAEELRSADILSASKRAFWVERLCQECSFSREIAEQCLADWAYALDVKLPSLAAEPVDDTPKDSTQSSVPEAASVPGVTRFSPRQAAAAPPVPVSAPAPKPAASNIGHASVPTLAAQPNSLSKAVMLTVLAAGIILLVAGLLIAETNKSRASSSSSYSSPTPVAAVAQTPAPPAESPALVAKGELPNKSTERRDPLHLSLPNGVALDMVWCPPGKFVKRSLSSGAGQDNKQPQNHVTMSKGFWMAKYELTQEQYKALMGSNPSEFKGPLRPVEQVSWYDAVAYCKKLNKACSGSVPSGYVLTLPTEAQWEYACRAGTNSALNNGRELTSEFVCSNLNQLAWYQSNSGGETHKVGKKRANAWGLYDMHGNVWEWCLDDDIVGGDDASDPSGSGPEIYKVSRGGSCGSSAAYCQSSCHWSIPPDCRFGYGLGFRPVCAPVQ